MLVSAPTNWIIELGKSSFFFFYVEYLILPAKNILYFLRIGCFVYLYIIHHLPINTRNTDQSVLNLILVIHRSDATSRLRVIILLV